ncbi:MAG: protein kinase [Actinomycetota bacterium]|nr:protein kinase [Actinomycetota bacterium]
MTESFNSDTRILLGRKLSGRYVLTSLISSESGTQTWLAKDLVLSREVAVVLTNPFQVINSDHISLFRKEAKLISRLNHPSIITVLDTTGDEDLEAIVIELVKEETLFDYVERTGPLSLTLALQITKQIGDALSYAHEKGVFHENLDPKHIFLCPDRGPQVSGFGFNKFKSLIDIELKTDTRDETNFRSDFIDMTSASTTHADIFSLGKILQYMLVGSLNIPRKNLFPKSVKKEILKSIEKATAGEVTERYSSVVDFIDDLEEKSANTNVPEEGVDESQTSKPFDPHTFITKFLLTGFVFFLVLGIVFAANGNPFSSDDNSEPAEIVQATPTPEASDTDPIEQTETEAGSIQTGNDSEVNSELSDTEVSPIFEMVSVLGADDFDPLGDGVEHPELIDNLLDEDPETIWYSETYANRSMGGLKDGVGVVIELKKPYELQRVAIETANTGWSGEIFVANAPQSALAAWGASVGSITSSQGNATVDLTGLTGGAVLVWFTDLGDKPPPGIRMEISGIEVS